MLICFYGQIYVNCPCITWGFCAEGCRVYSADCTKNEMPCFMGKHIQFGLARSNKPTECLIRLRGDGLGWVFGLVERMGGGGGSVEGIEWGGGH